MENVKNEPENQTIQGTRKFIRANGILSYFSDNPSIKNHRHFWSSGVGTFLDINFSPSLSWLKNDSKIWLKNDSKKTQIWFKYDSNMTQIWLIDDSNLVKKSTYVYYWWVFFELSENFTNKWVLQKQLMLGF